MKQFKGVAELFVNFDITSVSNESRNGTIQHAWKWRGCTVKLAFNGNVYEDRQQETTPHVLSVRTVRRLWGDRAACDSSTYARIGKILCLNCSNHDRQFEFCLHSSWQSDRIQMLAGTGWWQSLMKGCSTNSTVLSKLNKSWNMQGLEKWIWTKQLRT